MVVDDVQQHGDAARVAGLDKGFEGIRPAILGVVHRKQLGRVVAPTVATVAEFHNRHELNGIDTKVFQVIQLVGGGHKPVGHRTGRKRAHVQFVNEQVIQRRGW